MKNLLFYFLLISFWSSCDKESVEASILPPDCIQEKIDDFSQQEKSRSVDWTQADDQIVYKFRSLTEEVYLNDQCDTICQYPLISSFLPPCKFELDNHADWQNLWGE
jgi:hypothetical protein